MEIVNSAKSEDGGDTVIILPDVEVDAMFSVIDVLYRGQSSASTDYDKFQLTRLLLRLGLDRVARSLSLQLVTVREVRDENLNNLVNTKPPDNLKDPATIHTPAQTQPPPDIENHGGTSSPDQEATTNLTEAEDIINQTLNYFDADKSMTLDSPKLTSTPVQSSAFQGGRGEMKAKKDKKDIEKEKCVQEINVKMREEFAKLKLKDDRRKKRRHEEAPISKDSIAHNPKRIKEKKFKSNKRKGPSYEHKKESDPKLAVLQPYPLRNDCRIALGLRNIVPKAPKGKVFLAPAKIEAASKKSSSIVGVKKQKPPQSSIDHGNKGKSGEGTKKMLSVTPCDLLPSETQDSSSAPPLGYRKEAGRKTVRVRNKNQTRCR